MSGPTLVADPAIDPPGGRSLSGRRVLVLNASYEPLCVVPTRRAVLLLLSDKAESVHDTSRVLHAPSCALPEPSVVRLVRYVAVHRPARVALNRRTVFARDASTCQYCGAAAENLDHVIPKSKGGPHTWENVVAACRRCNSRKRDRLPREAGMALVRVPRAPHHQVWLLAKVGGIRSDWHPYLRPGLAEPDLEHVPA